MKMSTKIDNQKSLLAALADSQSQKLYTAIVKNAPTEFIQAVKEIFFNIQELNIDIDKENLSTFVNAASKVEEIVRRTRSGCLKYPSLTRLGIEVVLRHLEDAGRDLVSKSESN